MDGDLLGRRLRFERERRRIALESIAERTKISIGLLKDLERDQLSRWPNGIFRRSFIRAYAEAIGLDPDDTLKEFQERYPDPSQPVIPETRSAADSQSATAVAMARIAKPAPRPPVSPRTRPPLRMTLAEGPSLFSAGEILTRFRSRLAAAFWDLVTVAALAGLVYLWLNRFWMPLGIIMLCYHGGSILALGNTPGVFFVALAAHRARAHAPDPTADEEDAELASASMVHHRATS